MTVTVEYTVPITGRNVYSGLSSDSKPTDCKAGSEFFETDTAKRYVFDGATWIIESANGARYFATNGVITAASGSSNTYVLAGADASPITADDYISDATGFTGFSVEVPNTITTAQHVLVGWSTTAADQAAVAAILNTLDGHLDSTPASATSNANCAILSINKPGPISILWDGTTRIKTIAVRGHGAAYPTIVSTVG